MQLGLICLLFLAVDPPSERLPVFEDEVFVVGSGPLRAQVQPGETVLVRFGAGDLDVTADDVNEIIAQVELTCPPERKQRCGEVSKRLTVEPKRTKHGLTVKLGGVRKSLLRRLNIQGTIVVPRDSPLVVRAGAGDIDIDAGERSVAVQMFAGDLSIRAARDQFSDVAVRTNFGDASIRSRDGIVSSKRKKLVGAKADWQSGQTGQEIVVRLKFGDARVFLHEPVELSTH